MEEKETLKREERDTYLITYVDPYAKNVLRWADLTEEEQKDIKDYRTYLLDYTKEENWWLENPMTFDEWLGAKESVEEE